MTAGAGSTSSVIFNFLDLQCWLVCCHFSSQLLVAPRQFSISGGLASTSFPSGLLYQIGFLEKCKIPSGYKIASERDHIKLCVVKNLVCVYKIRMFSLLEIARVLVFHTLLVHSSE
jgi:hypothetical protein